MQSQGKKWSYCCMEQSRGQAGLGRDGPAGNMAKDLGCTNYSDLDKVQNRSVVGV